MYTEYADFYLHVGWPDDHGRFPIQVVRSPCGETRQPVWQENRLRLPACQHILDYLEELIAEPEEVELLGKSLHEFLFPAEVGDIFHRCRENREKGLRIRLRVDPEELSLLPWEYCYDPTTRQYLALERQTPIVRYIAEGFAAPTTLTMPRPAKLLIVLAAPKDQPALDMQREESGIRQALQNVPVELTVLRHATIEKLHDALLDIEPHILHFSGHGVVSGGIGALALEAPGSGNTDPLTARQIRGLLSRMGITLAVLNACETARHSTRDALMGVAQALIREEIPAVIAMQFLVTETVALMFTRRLYDFLFRGDPLEKIVTETRVGIDINAAEDRISWGIPVLFMRASDGFLWKPTAIRRGSGLDSLVTADLRSRSDLTQAQPVATEDIFLKKVFRQWAIDVLARSIPNAERRIDFVFRRSHDGSAEGAAETLSTVFDELDGSLLLLGAAGSGKTIALCELARDLIQRASAQEQRSLPVVLRLAPWHPATGLSLEGWIDLQLKAQYGLGQSHISQIKRRGLILLLDGLDEVCREHRSSCVKAINDYCAQAGWISIVITCRSSDYADLERSGQGLTIPRRQVVTLLPLESARVDRFLDQLDRVGVEVSHLRSLLENERTPLMADVILQTYEGKPAEHAREVRVADIWENYVARKFEDDKARREATGKALVYPPAMTRKWLSWVARQLDAHTQDRHRFFLEELQPHWLSKGTMLLSYGLTFSWLLVAAYLVSQFTSRAGLPAIYGEERAQDYLADYLRMTIPLGSLWIALLIWVLARRSPSYGAPIMMGLLSGIVFGTMLWIPSPDMSSLAVIGGGITGVILAGGVRLVIRTLGFSDRQIVCVRRRKWDWHKAGAGLIVGILFILITWLVSDITQAIVFEGMGAWPALGNALSLSTVVWWNWGLPGMLSMGVFLALVLGLGWGQVDLRDEVDLPNQGIIDSGMNGLTIAGGGVIAGLIFSLAVGVPCYWGLGLKASGARCVAGELGSLLSGLRFGAGYGAVLGLVFGLILGGLAWVRHHLLRLLLCLDGQQIPWRFGKFLAHATKLHLLRRVGGGFEFIDQDLQAYFERAGPSC